MLAPNRCHLYTGRLTDNPNEPGPQSRGAGHLRARETVLHDDVISHEDRDAMIRASLMTHGDSGITPRHTLFYFYGEGDHDDLNEVARRAGFVTRGQDDMTTLETTIPVDEASFAPISAMMQSWAAAFQLDYDGWECAVVTH